MSTIQENLDLAQQNLDQTKAINEALDAVVLNVAALNQQIADLIAAGGGATPAQLDALAAIGAETKANLDEIATDVGSASQKP